MIGSLVVFGVVYLAIATDKLDKTVAALLGAAICIFLQFIPYDVALRAVDLNVIFLLVGMMLVVNIMASTGMFEWLAIAIARKAKGDGLRIFLMFIATTAFVSAFLDNVTTVILIAPVTILVCQILEIPVVPLLILEAVFSNIGGTATLIGDPPNVLIASQTGLTFNEFIINLTPPVLIMMGVGLPIMAVVFKKKFVVPEGNKARIMRARPDKAILDPVNLKRSLGVFALILIAFFASHALGLQPGIIALTGALVMAMVCKSDLHHILEKVEWSSIFFFVGLFMLVGSMEHNHVFEKMGHFIFEMSQGNFFLTVMIILWLSAIVSSIVDNIPLVIAMIPLIETIVPEFARTMGYTDPVMIKAHVSDPLYWSLALGACLGGNGTLIGASANVVISQLGRRNGYPMTFLAFTKLGFPIMIGTVLIATGWLYVRYFL